MFAASFWGIIRLDSAFIIVWWFRAAHIYIQVISLCKGDWVKSISRFINRKMISCKCIYVFSHEIASKSFKIKFRRTKSESRDNLYFDLFIYQGWPTSQIPRATFLTMLSQRATSYTWAQMNITPPLYHWNKYLCSARFIVNITKQDDNDWTLQAIYR